MEKKRNQNLDMLKAFAILLVVLGHCLSEGNLRTYLYSFHIPLFLFLAGMVFETGNLSFAAFGKKKFRRLMLPYYAAGFMSIAVFRLFGTYAAASLGSTKNTDTAAWMLALKLLYGSGKESGMVYNSALWYLPCLMVIQCLLYGSVKLSGKREKKGRFLFAAVIVAAAALIWRNTPAVFLNWPCEIDTAFWLLPFSLLGYGAKIWLPWIRQRKIWQQAAGAAVGLTAGAVVSGWGGEVNYLVDIYGNMGFFYIGALLSCTGYMLLAGMVKKVPQMLSYLGRHTMVILLFHKFPVLFFQTVMPGIKQALNRNSIAAALGAAVLSVWICLLLEFLFRKSLFWKGRKPL